jgi:hypothetical protein
LKTTPCKVTWRRWHGCFDRSRKNILTRRANQWQFCIITKFAKTAMTLPDSGPQDEVREFEPMRFIESPR